MAMRNPYTKEEDAYLVAYIAIECPGLSGRQGKKLYQKLTENPKSYPWAKCHPWQSWRDRYKTNKAYFDYKIAKYQKRHGIDADVVENRSSQRVAFTDEEDTYLLKYLAVYCPPKTGRSGKSIYKQLVENAEGKWPWSARHPFQGWRSRYIDHEEAFDLRIEAYQRKHNIIVDAPPLKRTANGSQLERAAKRRKVEDTHDSQEERWSRIDWSGTRKHASSSKTLGPSKAVEVKVEAEQEAQICPVASTSKEQLNGNQRDNEIDSDDADDDDDDEGEDDDLEPIGSEDYRGEIFQNTALAESRSHVEEMPGIEEDVVGEEEAYVNNPSPPLNDYPNTDLEKELKEAEALAEMWEPKQDSPVDGSPYSSLSPPKLSQPNHGSFNRNDFTLISQSRRVLDDDPFEDVPSPPDHKRNLPLQKTKFPPVIIEGAFSNKLQTGIKKKSTESSAEESSDDKETSAAWLPSPRLPRTREADEVGAEPTWPPPRVKKGRAEGVNGTAIKVELEHPAAEQRRREKGKQKAVEYDESTEALVNGHHPPVASPAKLSQLLKSNVINIPEASSGRLSNAPRRVTDIFAPPAPLPETMGVRSPKRHSTGNIGGAMKPSNARTINFRQEIAHRQLLSQQRPLIPRRSSSRTSHVSSSFISEDDSRISRQQEFVSQCLMMFSEQFGFSVDVVSKTWEKLQNVGQMVEVLTRVKESADRRMDELMGGVSNVSSTFSKRGEDTSKSFESGLGSSNRANIDALDLNSSQSSPFSVVHPDQNGSSASKERRNSSVDVGGKRGRKSLEIRLVDPERASADTMLLYHPLSGTRAGNFDRLVKMGRGEEALEREQRRVSSVALSPLRNTTQEQQIQTQGRAGDELLGDNDDDVYEEVEISIQGEDSGEEDVERMDVFPDVKHKDEEMGEANFEAEGRMIKVEPDTSQPQLNGLERPYDDVGDEQSELNDSCPKANGRESVKQEIEFEPDIDGVKSRSAEKVEAMVTVRDEVERWEAVEDLFRAANRSNVEMLKETEKGFSIEFLMGWLASEFTI